MDKKYKDVKSFFKSELSINIDSGFLNKIRNFRLSWINKSDEYIEFLGSNLVGAHTIRFSENDDDKLANDVYDLPGFKDIQKEFYKVNDINKSFKVTSNVIYNILTYSAADAYNSNVTSKEFKEKVVKETMLIMQYKMFSSLYFRYFNYKVDNNIATTVYEHLSHKFIIKKKHSWGEVFNYRVETILDKHNPNNKRLRRFTTEDSVRIISDIQTKNRSLLIAIYGVLVQVKEEKEIIKQQDSTFIGGEANEKQVKEVNNDAFNYINKIQNIKYNKNDFIDTDIITVIDKLFPNTNKDILSTMISNVCEQKLHNKLKVTIKKYKNDKDPYNELLKDILILSFDYLNRLNLNITEVNNLPKSILLLKNYWSSSKVNNKDMKEVKKYIYYLSMITTGRKTKWILSTTTIMFILYIYIKALKK